MRAEVTKPAWYCPEYSLPRDSNRKLQGNLVADAMRDTMDADIAICNAGTIRGDSLYSAGTLLAQADLVREFPFPNGVITIKLKGKTLLEALEQVRL